MLSTSFVNELTRYAVSRLVTIRIAALFMLVIAVSLAISTHRLPTDIGTTILLAGLLIVQFRLWDDLADLNFDRNNHPDRTLVTSSNIRPYFILVAGLTVLSAMILAVLRPPSHWFTYVLLLAGTAIIYRRQVWPGAWRLVRMQLVLIKYPVFLYLCAQDGTPVSMARSGIAVYLLLSFIDLLSDATLRLLPARRWLLILELALFAVFMGTLLWSI